MVLHLVFQTQKVAPLAILVNSVKTGVKRQLTQRKSATKVSYVSEEAEGQSRLTKLLEIFALRVVGVLQAHRRSLCVLRDTSVFSRPLTI